MNQAAMSKIFVGVFMFGITWFASSIHSHMSNIDKTLVQIARFQGGVEVLLKELDRRVTNLEKKH